MNPNAIPLTEQQRAIDWQVQIDNLFGADRTQPSLPECGGSDPLDLPEWEANRGLYADAHGY